MPFNSPVIGTSHTIDRRVPVQSGRRSYVLDSTEYSQLIASGLDPETVAEAELAKRARCFRVYDAHERMIQEITTANSTIRTEYSTQGV